jgi:hypothetical protein
VGEHRGSLDGVGGAATVGMEDALVSPTCDAGDAGEVRALAGELRADTDRVPSAVRDAQLDAIETTGACR